MSFIFEQLDLSEVAIYFPDYKQYQDNLYLYTYFYLGSQSRRGNLGKAQSYLIIISDLKLFIDDKENHSAVIEYPEGNLQPANLWDTFRSLLVKHTITLKSNYDESKIVDCAYWEKALNDCLHGYFEEIIQGNGTEFYENDLQIIKFIRLLKLKNVMIVPVEKKPLASRKKNNK